MMLRNYGIIRRFSTSVQDFVKQEIEKNDKVLVFAKTTCGYCARAIQALDSHGIPKKVINLDKREDGPSIQAELSNITGIRTVPNIFICKKSVGGSSDLLAGMNDGSVKTLLDRYKIKNDL